MAKKQVVQDTSWEIKDRTYLTTGNQKPLTLKIPSKHSARHPLLHYDNKKNEQRELRYATNQNSPFKDEQNGEVLQKILSLYHPLKNKIYRELDQVEIAKDDLFELELEIDALNAAKNIDIDQAEAIMRVEMGSKVAEMSSKELKRDLLLFAKNNPKLFLELANDDNVQLRNFAIRAAEANIIKLADDQRTFHWASNGRKLMTVPFDENPYSAMASFFKTDEGIQVFQSIEKKFS